MIPVRAGCGGIRAKLCEITVPHFSFVTAMVYEAADAITLGRLCMPLLRHAMRTPAGPKVRRIRVVFGWGIQVLGFGALGGGLCAVRVCVGRTQCLRAHVLAA